MTVQGLGASLSPAIGGWIAQELGYSAMFMILGSFASRFDRSVGRCSRSSSSRLAPETRCGAWRSRDCGSPMIADG